MDDEHLAKKTRRESFLIEAVDLLRIGLIVLVLLYLIPNFVVRPETVVGRSMLPTLEDKEQVFCNVFSALVFGIDRFDVVAIVEPKSGEQWVKRVIGLPGETIEYKEGKLYIDGVYYEETFLDDAYISSTGHTRANFTADFEYRQLGEDEYFVMGDNRPDSLDSRMRGPFDRSDIIAKHVYVLWPFDKMRVVTNDN